jgi:microcystin-dependent protein
MSGLNLSIAAGTVPYGTALPGSAQALINFVAAYGLINGQAGFNGLNYGATTPPPEAQNLPWFKTDQYGNPIGFFSWNGATWATIPSTVANGTFANAPAAPTVGTEYFATDLGCLIIFSSSGWTTASGTVGDLKAVTATSIATALTNNPGWAQHTASIGCVIGNAGPATGISVVHNPGDVIGEENHTLTINEIPSHTHAFTGYLNGASANGNTGPGGILSDHNATATQGTGGSAGHNTIQPTFYGFWLVKMF